MPTAQTSRNELKKFCEVSVDVHARVGWTKTFSDFPSLHYTYDNKRK